MEATLLVRENEYSTGVEIRQTQTETKTPAAGMEDGKEKLKEIVHECWRYIKPSRCKTIRLRVRAAFVAHGGVICVALEGWPRVMATMKRKLNAVSCFGKPENKGSMFPKISVACLADGESLTLEELRDVMRCCREASDAFAKQNDDDDDDDNSVLHFTQLDAIVYACRSLERLLVTAPIRLLPDAPETIEMDCEDGDNDIDGGNEIDKEERARIDVILSEACDESHIDTYFPHVNVGRTEQHYREDACGATLVACATRGERAAHNSRVLASILEPLQESIERRFPSRFVFFTRSSLHVTLRAIL